MTPLEEQPTLTDDERSAIDTLLGDSLESDDVPAALEEVSVDTIFEMLAHPGRRYVITYLLRSEGFASMSELVDYVMEETGHTMTDRQFRYRIALELTHNQIPRLADEGFVRYNIERQMILPTDRTTLLEPYITIALAQQQLRTTAGGDERE